MGANKPRLVHLRGVAVSPAELEAEVASARQGVKDCETALCVAEDRLIRALKAQEVGAAVGTRPAEYKPYDNEIPEKLYIRARQTGLRDFFSAPKDAP